MTLGICDLGDAAGYSISPDFLVKDPRAFISVDDDSRTLAYRASLQVATELVQSDTGGIVEGDSQMEVVEGLDNREEVAFANRTTSKQRSSNV